MTTLVQIIKKKDIILNNLIKIQELGIKEFEFNSEEIFLEKHRIIIQENKNDSIKKYCVRGFCTDKEKQYISQPEEGVYEFVVSNPKYIIEYTKGSLSQDKITMIVNSLDFNTNTLPNIKELTDPKILPNIEFDYIKRKNQAVNFNYASTMSLKSAKDLLIYSNALLKQLETIGLSKEHNDIKSQLEMIKKFIDNLSQVQKDQLEKYINEKLITRSELHNLTIKKTEQDRTKKKTSSNKNNKEDKKYLLYFNLKDIFQ